MLADEHDPRLNLLNSLDFSACRVEFSDKPIVLLCGGPVKFKLTPESPEPPVLSLRHAITNLHPSYEIFRPEEVENWQSDGIFKDLMSFESELAAICSLVVIILESEGAIAELGAFSQLPDLSEKIVAVCPEKFRHATSFINFGILRFIAAKKSTNVKSYPWAPDHPSFVISPELVEDVVSDIQGELDQLAKSQLLRVNHHSHVMVLICELLRFFTALKEHEILEYLIVFGVNVDPDALKGKLFLLCEFELIKMQGYSDAHFYLSGKASHHKLRLALKAAPKPIDVLRIQMECLDFYKNNSKHRNRIRAIAEAKTRALR